MALFTTLVEFLVATIGTLGYLGIFLLMTLESTFIPLVPSELVIIPAGIQVARGVMNPWLVMLFGVGGSLAGALINYLLALSLGRKLVNALFIKYGRVFFVSQAQLVKSEAFFARHGSITTFVGRLIIGVRHFISLPAGFSKMPLGKFCLYTGLGSALWVGILLYLGVVFGQNLELITEQVHTISYFLIVGAALLSIVYILWKKKH